MKMDKMENVDFVRKRYATILRGIYSHSQIEVVTLSNLNIMSLTKVCFWSLCDICCSQYILLLHNMLGSQFNIDLTFS